MGNVAVDTLFTIDTIAGTVAVVPPATCEPTASISTDGVTPRCPRNSRCESCGTSGDVEVVVLTVLRSTLCMTLCDRCRASGRCPAILLSTAEKFVVDHQKHVAGYITHT